MRSSRLLRCLLADGLWGLWRSRGLSLAAALIIGLTFSVVALELTAADNLSRGVANWGRTGVVRVFMAEGFETERLLPLAEGIRRWPGVGAVEELDPERLRERFTRWYPEMGDLAELFTESPFPAELEVTLQEDLAATARQHLVSQLQQQSGVDAVLADDPVGQRLGFLAAQVLRVGQVCGVIFGLVAGLAVAGVIRLSLVSQHDELAVMLLIGAPRLLLKGPLVLQGLWLGLAGGLLSLLVAAVAHLLVVWLAPADPLAVLLMQAPLGARTAVLLVAATTLAGGLGALLAVRGGRERA